MMKLNIAKFFSTIIQYSKIIRKNRLTNCISHKCLKIGINETLIPPLPTLVKYMFH